MSFKPELNTKIVSESHQIEFEFKIDKSEIYSSFETTINKLEKRGNHLTDLDKINLLCFLMAKSIVLQFPKPYITFLRDVLSNDLEFESSCKKIKHGSNNYNFIHNSISLVLRQNKINSLLGSTVELLEGGRAKKTNTKKYKRKRKTKKIYGGFNIVGLLFIFILFLSTFNLIFSAISKVPYSEKQILNTIDDLLKIKPWKIGFMQNTMGTCSQISHVLVGNISIQDYLIGLYANFLNFSYESEWNAMVNQKGSMARFINERFPGSFLQTILYGSENSYPHPGRNPHNAYGIDLFRSTVILSNFQNVNTPRQLSTLLDGIVRIMLIDAHAAKLDPNSEFTDDSWVAGCLSVPLHAVAIFTSTVTGAAIIINNNNLSKYYQARNTGKSNFESKYFILYHPPNGKTIDNLSGKSLQEYNRLVARLGPLSLASDGLIPYYHRFKPGSSSLLVTGSLKRPPGFKLSEQDNRFEESPDLAANSHKVLNTIDGIAKTNWYKFSSYNETTLMMESIHHVSRPKEPITRPNNISAIVDTTNEVHRKNIIEGPFDPAFDASYFPPAHQRVTTSLERKPLHTLSFSEIMKNSKEASSSSKALGEEV